MAKVRPVAWIEAGQSARPGRPGANPWPARDLRCVTGLTQARAISTISRLMSAEVPPGRVPEVLDAWRLVAARRGVEGRLPLSALTRLQGLLYDVDGEVRFSLDFDTDELRVPYAELKIEAGLPLLCQRSLERFVMPVRIEQRLGLIRDEADEAALPPGYEPLLMPEDGMLRPAEMVEDELILAVPVVPVAPDSEAVERDFSATQVELDAANPFAALSSLKKNN
ncbi:DUF177 domain-containing protein [Lysobacter enzymogenes]|nr:DUF177 domain-containing protein [Lysobacter enzymogenes]